MREQGKGEIQLTFVSGSHRHQLYRLRDSVQHGLQVLWPREMAVSAERSRVRSAQEAR